MEKGEIGDRLELLFHYPEPRLSPRPTFNNVDLNLDFDLPSYLQMFVNPAAEQTPSGAIIEFVPLSSLGMDIMSFLN